MKLQQLPIGARFEYEGQVFTKTGPMTASAEKGGQRIIPRYATLTPLDGAPSEGDRSKVGQVDLLKVQAAFSSFHETCRELVDESAWPALEAARREFFAALK